MNLSVEIVGDILQALKERQWRENLQPPLRDFWINLKEVVGELDSLLKRFQESTITLEYLKDILAVWEKTDKFIKIKEMRLDICGRGYGEYGGVSFKSSQEMQKLIDEWDPKTNIIHRTLTQDPHKLVVQFQDR